MKFLCPNCKAKYRIGPEKMVGRQAAKIRCRKCEYLIQISYRGNSDEFDVTATPPSVAPPAPAPVPAPRQPPKASTGQPVMAPVPLPNAVPRARTAGPLGAANKDEGVANKRPTAAVPGLPGLGSPRSTRGAALHSDAAGLVRRPLAPPPPPPPAPALSSAALGAPQSPPAGAPSPAGAGSLSVAAVPPPSPASPVIAAAVPPPSPAPPRSVAGTQLGDQFRESVQAGGVPEDLPQEGWFVGVNGVPLGPIPLGDLRELALAGHIDRRSLVWREGQAEWRPLGKLPGLARVIDDGAAPVATPRPEPAQAAAPAPARSNGTANGHIATGFDVVRASTGERPSAWGDLDDEDDADEQPTTVKGRVSVLPSPGSIPAPPMPPAPTPPAPSAPPPPVAPPAASSSSANPFGVTSSVLAVPMAAPQPAAYPSAMPPPVSAPPVAADGGPASSISNTPEPVVDAEVGMIRSSGRSRWYLIIAAIVFAFALGAIVTHLMRSPSTPERSGKSASNAESAKPPPAAPPKAAEPLAEEVEKEPPAPPAEVEATAPAQVERAPAAAVPKVIPGAMVAPTSAVAPAPPTPQPRPATPNSLLAGLGSSQTPGPSLGKNEEHVTTGSGLDATAIQRTVRRYSPGVRQNCWQRALNARAPGAPSSAKVSATITVDAAGHVEAVSVSGAPKGYPSLARCIEGNVKAWQFPRAGAQTVTNVPFMFVGQ